MSGDLLRMSEEYTGAARMLEQRIEELEEQAGGRVRDDRMRLRIARLRQMRDETLKTAEYLREYYHKGPSPSLKH